VKILYLSALNFLAISGDLGRGLRLWSDLFLTNDSDRVKGLMTEPFKEAAGKLEVGVLSRCNAAVFQTKEVAGSMTRAEGMNHLNEMMGLSSSFLTTLWLVKDNSVNFDVAFVEHPYKSPTPFISNNSRSSYYSDSAGTFRSTSFSPEELRQARRYFDQFNKADFQPLVKMEVLHDPNETSRIERAFYLLQAARSTSDLGSKISIYMTCMESLFCTDSLELSHKLAERSSLFLSEAYEERLQIFKTVKKAYGIRSKQVHGDRLSPKLLRELSAMSTATDELLRRILTKILSTKEYHGVFSSNPDDLEKFMLDLLFASNQR
jgi:hypothetical protein